MIEPRKSVTAEDVAREAGVSAWTAAAALRGSPAVKPATAERILAVASRLGYRRNTAASILASQRTSQKSGLLEIGMLTINSAPRNINEYPDVVEMFRSAVADQWLFEPRFVNQHSDAESVVREWSARGFDGIIIWRVYPDSLELSLPLHQFSVVATSHHRLRDGFDVVRCSHYFEQDRLLKRVQERGYRRIGMVSRTHDPATPEDRARLAAMLEFQHRQAPGERIPILERPFPTGNNFWNKDVKALAAYVRRHRPEAIVAFNGSEAEMLGASGIVVPADVGFACLNRAPAHVGKLFGTLGEHWASIPVLLAHLSRKIRAGERGTSAYPIEVVFRCPEVEGESLPLRA